MFIDDCIKCIKQAGIGDIGCKINMKHSRFVFVIANFGFTSGQRQFDNNQCNQSSYHFIYFVESEN